MYWGDVGPDAGSDGGRGPRGYDEVNQARSETFSVPNVSCRTSSSIELSVTDPEDGTSDFDEAEEEDGWEFIDSAAPGRVFVEAIPIDSAAGIGKRDPPGMALIRNSGCLNCHAINRPLVGPSFVAIADKYRNQPHEMEKSVERVLKGSKAGPVIGTTSIEVNGDWEAFYEKTVDLRNATGVEDLFFVFLNKERPGGLMNIDSVDFQRKGP